MKPKDMADMLDTLEQIGLPTGEQAEKDKLTELEKIEKAVERAEHFNTCLFCGEKVKKFPPLQIDSVYSYCPKCGSTGTVTKGADGKIYFEWKRYRGKSHDR